MVQVLPGVPSFGEKLATVLGQAGTDIGEGINQRRARTALNKILNPQSEQQMPPGSEGQTQTQTQNTQPSTADQLPIKAMQIYDLASKAYGPQQANVLAKGYIESQKLGQHEQQTIRAEERAAKNKAIEKRTEGVGTKLESINSSRRNLMRAREAVQSGDVGAFSKSSFADLFGDAGRRFKDAKGAELESATKHLLFDTLKDVTAKGTNLWLEKVALSASPQLGKTEEANETLITIALGDLDIKEKKIQLEQDLIGKYESLGIKPPANFDVIVNDLLKPYAQQVEDQMAYDTRVIYEREKGPRELNNLVKVPKGTPLTLEKRDALIKKAMKDSTKPISEATPEEKQKAKNAAVKLGYTIPKFDPNNRVTGSENVE